MAATHTFVRPPKHDPVACGVVVDFLALIGDKWTVMVVGALSQGTRRYGELHREIGRISQRMLTRTLKGLEENGLVRRTVHPTIPPRVEYTLTKMGHTLVEPLHGLHLWTTEHRPAMQEARRAYAEKTKKKKKA